MEYLKIGLILLLAVRVLAFFKGRGDGSGEPVTHNGDILYTQVNRNKSKRVDGFEVSVDVPDRFRFSLRPETSFDRTAKVLGVAQEWQTGDESFDSAAFIGSGDQALLETMSADSELRTLLMTLLRSQRGGALECARGRLTFVGVPTEEYFDVSDEFARVQLARDLHTPLVKIRDRLSGIAGGDWAAVRDPALRRRAWFVGISVLLAMAGIGGFIVELGLARHQIVHDTIPYWTWRVSLALSAALLVAMALCLRKTPYAHIVLLDILVVAPLGAWFASYGVLTWYNQKHDIGAPVRAAVEVESAYSVKHSGSPTYHLVVAKWPDGRGGRDVILPQTEYALVNPGRCVFATLHPGRLGDTWVSGFEHAFAEDCDLERIE